MTAVELRDYYNKLSKKEKMKFKNFVTLKCEMGMSTLYTKLVGKSEFSKPELIVIGDIIKQGLWNK